MAARRAGGPLRSFQGWRHRPRDPRPSCNHGHGRTVNNSSNMEGTVAAAVFKLPGSVAAIYWLWALGAVIVALTLATPFAFRIGGDNYYMAMMIPAGLVALVATRIAEATPTRHALLLIIAVAV